MMAGMRDVLIISTSQAIGVMTQPIEGGSGEQSVGRKRFMADASSLASSSRPMGRVRETIEAGLPVFVKADEATRLLWL